MSDSIFPKVDKCNAVKIWSKQEMTDDMMLFGWSAFNQYQRDITNGKASGSGCIYSNKWFAAWVRKTASGTCSVKVEERK